MIDVPLEIKTTQGDMLRIDPLGAKIEVFLSGVLVLGSFKRGDGKQGTTHPCTPIFGPDRKGLYGLKQHGNMRNEICSLQQEGEGAIITHMIIDEGYPSGMQVKQEMKLTPGFFQLIMTHTNTGNQNAALNAGEHCYFTAPHGFEGTKINGHEITDLIKNNYDGIAIDLQEKNTIKIPGNPEYTLEQQGFKKAVVWVGKNSETKVIDKTYVCIEPVEEDPFGDYFGTDKSLMKPGESRFVQFRLIIK